jgi:hypothetical protein
MSDTATHYHAVRDGVTYEYLHDGDQAEMRGLDENGSYSAWDLGHYRKVKEAREKQNLNKVAGKSVAHPFVGKELVNTKTGKRYHVERVTQNWWFGSFLRAILRSDGNSHAEVFIENINCVLPAILNQIRDFEGTFQLVK